MTATTPRPVNRLPLWATVLALASLEDLALTLIALHGIKGAHELNPIAAATVQYGVLPAVGLKLGGLIVSIVAAFALAHGGHARRAERSLAFWSIAFIALNAYSTTRLVGGI